jgi:hypothetical protein
MKKVIVHNKYRVSLSSQEVIPDDDHYVKHVAEFIKGQLIKKNRINSRNIQINAIKSTH